MCTWTECFTWKSFWNLNQINISVLIFLSIPKTYVTLILLCFIYFYVWTEQAVAVAGGIIGGILLFVLIGITAYLLWKKFCWFHSYEKLTGAVKMTNANAVFQDQSEIQLKSTRYIFLFFKAYTNGSLFKLVKSQMRGSSKYINVHK